MKFGPVPVRDAAGAVLAHSVHAGGMRLRKGRVLTENDVTNLVASGLAEVTVARLAPDDVAENSAALRLAKALTKGAKGVHLTEPFTGRVNIVADIPGVVLVAAEAIDAVNARDPMITCATVAPLTRLEPGALLATIKIISYAVSEAALSAAEAAASNTPCLGMHPVTLDRAELILTETGAEPDAAKGVAAIEGRLTALGLALEGVTTVRHETGAISAALRASRAPLVLILTASATSDPADVAPEAVRVAGGTVGRFGMPVDPGNLLFLGQIGSQQVIGLPGCARSPALNGADWVLERVACGLDVSHDDIAAMGVGGLLKEIPQRPQPRRGAAKN